VDRKGSRSVAHTPSRHVDVILILGVLSSSARRLIFFRSSTFRSSASFWTYSGMGPEEMTNRITTNTERAFTTTVK